MVSLKAFDILLIKGSFLSIKDLLVMLFTRSRYSGCAVVISEKGEVLEAREEGIVSANILEYRKKGYDIFRHTYIGRLPEGNRVLTTMLTWSKRTSLDAKKYTFLERLNYYLEGADSLDSYDKWVDSEFCYWLFEENSVNLYADRADLITPSFFARSKHFIRVIVGG